MKKSTMLYIRVDGNAEIGTGHVMRCLSIAHTEIKSGSKCTFITADTQMKPMIEEHGFSVICLDSVWNDLERETDKMEKLISEQKIERLLIDSYFVTPDYLSRLNKLTYLIYIDDLNEFIYPCSELINYGINAEKLDYPSRYPNTFLRLGLKYVPLREEFWDLPMREAHKQARAVLITTGGSDKFNVAGQFVEKAMNCSDVSHMQYHIVAGKFNEHLSELNKLAVEFINITVHQNIGNMAELMLSCDIAVSAGGSTLYELCACSVPTVVFSIADNQLAGVSAFSDGYMLGCGDYRDDADGCLDMMVAGVAKFAEDFELRKTMAKRCWELMNQ